MIVAFDTETFLISPGLIAPPLVCVSVCNGGVPDLFKPRDGIAAIRGYLEDDQVILVGHNVAYDFGVLCAADSSLLPLVFHAYEKERIHDTKIREKLLALSEGTMRWGGDEDKPKRSSFALADLVEKYIRKKLPKGEDTWRLRYDQLVDVPLDQWPEDAKQYALDDAQYTWKVYLHQNHSFGGRKIGNTNEYIVIDGVVRNEAEQARAAWGLHLMTVWGMRTDGEAVASLKASLEQEVLRYDAELRQAGIVRENGTKDTEAIRERIKAAYGDRIIPTTEKTKKIKASAEVLKESGDPVLEHLSAFKETAKLLSDFIPKIEEGTKISINPSYDELVSSGRTSSFKPNIQQLPRKGGVRECFIPRPGYVFVDCDYSGLELCALGQICLDMLGESRIVDALKEGKDLHLVVAAQLLQMNYETALQLYAEGDERVKEYRQLAKPINFGYPGGMSPPTFVAYASGQGFKISEQLASVARNAWFASWTEMRGYFEQVKTLLGHLGEGPLFQQRSGRVRYTDSYTAACNTFFQGLAADGAKEAVFRVAKECYSDRSSPLYGTRPIAFIHDEILCESPEHLASAAADRLAQVMIDAMKVYIPDVPIKAEPVIMRRWLKGAKSVRDEDGRLQVWEPKKKEEAQA